ncbi:hypothetical protein HOD29_04820 [archaeon]|jgi:hypothetical protein|nr:hypothetical protein [archaeon]
MAVKRKIKGQCYEVRERNTSAGKKGTIIKKCSKKLTKKSVTKSKKGLGRSYGY